MKTEILQHCYNSLRKTEIYLEFPSDISVHEWSQIGRELYSEGKKIIWHTLDWAACGESHGWLKMWCEGASVSYGTYRVYAYVSSRFAIVTRETRLDYSHHRELASHPKQTQRKWLNKAVENGWSVDELRRQMRGEPLTISDGPRFNFIPDIVRKVRTQLVADIEKGLTADSRAFWLRELEPLHLLYQQLEKELIGSSGGVLPVR